MPPLFKIRRLSFVNTDDEVLLRKINVNKSKENNLKLDNGEVLELDEKFRPNVDANYLKLYKDHKAWLDKVIKEIKEGKRVGFGAFYNFSDYENRLLFPEEEYKEECLLGSIILKKGHEGQIELKNLLTNHYAIRNYLPIQGNEVAKYKRIIIQSLLDRVENFCSFRNYRRLEIEIPSLNIDTINFFLNNHFEIQHTKRSKSNDKDYFYIFQKQLSNFQGSDPYDDIKLVDNILSHYYPFIKIAPKQLNYSEVDLKTIAYELPVTSIVESIEYDADEIDVKKTSSQIVKKESSHDDNLKITIECKVDFDFNRPLKNEAIIIDKYFLQKFDPSANIKILFTDKNISYPSVDNYPLAGSIKILNWKSFQNLDDVKKLQLDKLISKNAIKGFLLVVDERAKRNILEKVNNGETQYLLHLFNGCGNYLQNADNTHLHNELKLFFFSYSNSSQSTDGIWGYADIKKVGGGNADFMRDEEPIPKIYGDNEKNYFSYYNDEKNSNVVYITVANITSLSNDKVISLNEVLSPTIQSYILTKEGNKNNKAYWYDTFWFNSYLDVDTVNKVMSHPIVIENKKNDIEPKIDADEIIATKTIDTKKSSHGKKSKKRLKKIVILTALKEEYEAVVEHLKNIKRESKNGTIYETGTFEYDNQEIAKVIVRECGKSNTVAAQETERAINTYKPYMLLFVGIAGSRKKHNFDVGDVIVANKIYGYEAGKSEKDSFHTRPEFGGTNYILNEYVKYESKRDSWTELIIGDWKGEFKAAPGVIASGEKLIEDYDSSIGELLTNNYNDTDAVETEGFGFGTVVSRQNIVRVMGVIRGISDILKSKNNLPVDNSSSTEDRRPTENKKLASSTAAAFSYMLILSILRKDI